MFPISTGYMVTSFGFLCIQIEECSEISSKLIGIFLEVLNFNNFFLSQRH